MATDKFVVKNGLLVGTDADNGVDLVQVNGTISATNISYSGSISGDGSGLTGVDADTVDGIQGASLLRSDADDTASGNINFTSTGSNLPSHYYHNLYSGNIVYSHAYPSGYTLSSGATQFQWRASDGTNYKVLSWHGSNGLTANGNGTFTGDVAVNGGDLTTTQTTFNLINATATTLNIGGAATAVNIGASTGTTTVNHNMTVTGNLTVNGTTTTLNTQTILAEDPVIVLNSGQATPSNDIGLLFQRYSSPTSANYNVAIMWDEGSDRLIFGSTAETGADTDITPASEWMTIEATGDVGIGTTNPNTKLQVYHNEVAAQVFSFDSTKTITPAMSVFMAAPRSGNLGLYTASTERLTVNGSGLIGIGTTNPQVELHVYDSASWAQMRVEAGADGNDASAAFAQSGTIKGIIGYDDSSDTVAIKYGTFTGSGIDISSAGNVGIGTNAPSPNGTKTTLHINGDSVGSAIRLSQAASSSLIRFDTTSGLKIGTISSYLLALQTGDTDRLTIDTSGNVGIGITNPSYLLHVNGSMYSGTHYIEANSLIRRQAGSWGANTPHDVLYNGWTASTQDYVYVKSAGNSTGPHGQLIVGDSRVYFGETTNETGGIVDNATTPFDTNTWGWVGNSNSYFKGDVGIGTTSPSGKLNVYGTGVASAPTLAVDTTSSATFVHSQENLAANLTTGQSNVIVVGKEGTTKNAGYIGYRWYGAASNTNILTLGHWASDYLVNITAGGNVGIGTTNPAYGKLQVYGDMAIGGDSTDAILRFIEGTDGWTIRHVAAGNRLAMSNVLGGTDHFNITETGSVGIGTTAPAEKLDVNGHIRMPSLASGGGITFHNNREFQIVGTDDGTYSHDKGLIISTLDYNSYGISMGVHTSGGLTSNLSNFTPQLRIDNNGNVGIGTESPSSKLEVQGDITVNSSVIFKSPDDTNTITQRMTDADVLSWSGDAGQLFSLSDSLTGTIFSVNDVSGVPSIEVDDDGTIRLAETFGNVLIGTAADDGTNKLQVNGSISAPTWTYNTTSRWVNTAQTDRTLRFGTFSDDSASYFGPLNDAGSHQLIDLGTSDGKFRNGHFSGTVYAGTFSGAVSGNATTASSAAKWTTARTITLSGDLSGSVSIDGSANVTLSGAVADNSHNHTSLTGVTSIGFAAEGSDSASISTTISGTGTYFDFNLTDDNNNDWWRWRFTPSGSTVYDAMTLKPVSNGNANLTVSGTVTADSFSGNASSATIWATARTATVTLTGDATGTAGVSVNGSANWTNSIAVTVDKIDGQLFVNTRSNSGLNATSTDGNGIYYYNAGVDNFSGNSTDGALYQQSYSTSWYHQIAGDYRSGNMAVRGKNNGTWQRWKSIPTIAIQDAAPSTTLVNGDLWYESDTATLYIRYGGAWVDVAPQLTLNSSPQFNALGVGTPASTTAGTIRATNDITAYYSDARLKDFEGTIPNALDKVMQLNGYYFRENATAKGLGYSNDERQVGVSAQEVQAVLPEVVTEAPISDEYLTVKYEKMVPLLIEAMKEQQAMIDELREEIKKLRGDA